jgi:glycosyltransferase involved in cell wall biosynthesis
MTRRLVYVFTTAFLPWHFQKEQNLFLRKRGFELHLAASPDDYFEKTCRRDGLTAHPLDIPRTPSPWRDLKALKSLMCLFRALRPDIVHAGAPKSAFLAMLAARLTGVKSRFFACHGTITGRRGGAMKLFYRLIEGITARLANSVWCVSPSLLEFMSRNGIIPGGRGFVIGHGSPNGFREEWLNESAAPVPGAIVRLERDKPAGGFPVVGFMGRLCRQKGLEVLAEAWPEIRKRCPEARLLLVGPWEKVDAVSKPCRRRLENDPSVILPGLVEQGAVGRCYRLMDVLLLPSLGHEGMLIAILEGALCGVPSVASNVAGCVDAVVDGVTGRLVPPGDASALAEAATKYLQHPALAKAHGEAGRQRVLKDFRPEPIWEGLLYKYSQYERPAS